MSQVISFKCPSCGGYLVFDPAKQRFQCPYCGGSFEENLSHDPDPLNEADDSYDEW